MFFSNLLNDIFMVITLPSSSQTIHSQPKLAISQQSPVRLVRHTHLLDATGVSVGRFASHIAQLLMGKHKTSWRSYKDVGDIVHVKNVQHLKLTGKKLTNKVYVRYSGYPGGLKSIKSSELLAQNPQKLLRLAVYNMLPKNFQRDRLMKRLRFHS